VETASPGSLIPINGGWNETVHEGEDRGQATLLPDCLEDYISEDNPVRIVDVFIDELDLKALGFDGVEPQATGAARLSSGNAVEALSL
jgi:transposase